MVLQRWQTVMLLFALALMVVFILTPMAYLGATPVYVWENTGFFILNLVIGALILIDIFLYKNLKLQMTVALISILLLAVSVGLGCVVYTGPDLSFTFFGVPFTVAALVMTWFARRFMAKDRRLLAAADRLR